MYKLTIVFFIILTIGCSLNHSKQNTKKKTINFYTEIVQEVKKYNDTAKSGFYLKTKSFDPTKYNFKLIDDKLENSKHVIYLFTWNNHMPTVGTNDFRAIVFDINNDKKYFFYNSQSNYKKINIEYSSSEYFEEPIFILNNYNSGKIEYLKSFQNRYSSAEAGQSYLIVEIESGKTSKILQLEAFSL